MRVRSIAVFAVALFVAGGCASRNMQIVTTPAGAQVVVNGQSVGTTPVKYDFDYGKRTRYDVSVSKVGYLEASQTLYSDTPLANADSLKFDLAVDQTYELTTESDAANQWIKIPIAVQFNQAQMWQRVVDSVTTRYSNLEQMDQAAGYLRSVAIVKSFKNPAQGEYALRTYFLGTVAGTDPLVLKVKIASERSDGSDKWTAYPRIYREDQQLIEELQTRLGMKSTPPTTAEHR